MGPQHKKSPTSVIEISSLEKLNNNPIETPGKFKTSPHSIMTVSKNSPNKIEISIKIENLYDELTQEQHEQLFDQLLQKLHLTKHGLDYCKQDFDNDYSVIYGFELDNLKYLEPHKNELSSSDISIILQL